MKKTFIVVILAGLFFCSIGNAQEEGFGLGVILGEPTGLCFKSWIRYQTALVGAAAWSFGDEDSLHIHLDYIRHDFKLIKIEEDTLPFYYGIGLRLKNEKKVRFGIRFPIGINYMFKKAPLDLFIEFVPVFDLAPKTDLFFNGGFGLRYFF